MAQFTVLAANLTDKALEQVQLIRLQEAAIKYSKLVKENPANHAALYNLAVISYRLQKYANAEKHFTTLLEVKAYHLLAKYNLGLVANKQQKRQQSIDWFLEISNYSNKPSKADKKIIRLAEIQLKKLLADRFLVKKKPAKNQLKTYLLAKVGYDDRVEDTVGNIYTSDDFLKFYGLLTFKLKKVYPGFETRVSIYDKSFDTFTDFNYQLLTVDAGQRFKQGKWKHLVRLGYSQSSFGVTEYLSSTYLDVRTHYRLQKNQNLSAGLRYDDHQSENQLYDDYAGSQQRLHLQYEWRQKPHKFRVKLEIEDNNRTDDPDDLNAGVIDNSYSPHRDKLQLTWYYDLNKSWKGYLRFENRDSRYNDFSSSKGVVRDEQRQQTTLQVKYLLKKGWYWVNKLQYTDNTSNIFKYDYQRTLFSSGVSGYF